MVKKQVKRVVTNEKIMEVLLDIDERIVSMNGRIVSIDELVVSMDERMVTKSDLEDVLKGYPTKADLAESLKDYATKNDLERMKDEIIDVINPAMKAIDKDAETIIGHGKRIAVLERRVGIATK